jgi:MYXO-CTERM domain-containing protein
MVAWSVWALGIATAHLAAAEPTCSVSQIGQACAGGSTVCVQATCTTPQSSGAGTSVTCGVCTPVSGVYCLPDDVGKACSDGGVCTFGGGSSGGGGGDGIIQSYELQTCVDPVDAGAGGSSSGVLGPSCPPEDDGKPCDGGGICMIYGGSSGGGLPPVSEAACTVPGSGSSGGSLSGSGSTSGSSSGAGSSSSGAGSGGDAALGASSGSSGSSSGPSGSGSSGSSAGGSTGAASGGSASSSGGSASGSGASAGTLDAGDVEAGADPGRGGVGCSLAPGRPSGWFGWLALAGALALLRRRRTC